MKACRTSHESIGEETPPNNYDLDSVTSNYDLWLWHCDLDLDRCDLDLDPVTLTTFSEAWLELGTLLLFWPWWPLPLTYYLDLWTRLRYDGPWPLWCWALNRKIDKSSKPNIKAATEDRLPARQRGSKGHQSHTPISPRCTRDKTQRPRDWFNWLIWKDLCCNRPDLKCPSFKLRRTDTELHSQNN